LIIMTRDEEAARNGYSANSYLEILNDQMEVCFEPDRTFMQDNASIHTAKKIKNWFRDEGISLLNWPPYSPDMNPIEHVWKKLKEVIHQRHPELIDMGKSEADLLALSAAIIDAWDAIPQTWLNNLIDSMPRRVEAVRKKKGWHTKY